MDKKVLSLKYNGRKCRINSICQHLPATGIASNRIFFRIITFLSIITLFCTPVSAQEKEGAGKNIIRLTFSDALARMGVSNDAIVAAQMEEEQRRYERKAARGMYYPKVEIKANGVKMQEPIVMDLNDIRTAILKVQKVTLQGAGVNPATINAYSQQTASQLPSFEKVLAEDKFFTVNGTITMPVYTGGKITAANDAAGARLDEAHQKLTDTKNRLISEMVGRYFGLRLTVKVVEVRKMVYEGMEKHLKEARALEESGMIARVERLHAEVAYSEADREYKKAMRNSELALTALNNTLNTSYVYDPSTPLFVIKEVQPLAVYQKSALDSNPLIKQVSANRELAHQGYLKEMSTYQPDIFVFASRELYGWQIPDYLPKWYAGFGATCTLFEGFAGMNKVQAAKAQEERVAALESKVRRDILTLVEKNYQELMQAIEQYESIKSSYRFAEEYLRVREKAFAEGSATSLDVVDAQLAFAKVRIDKLKAAYDFETALAALLEASGQSSRYEEYMKNNEEVEF